MGRHRAAMTVVGAMSALLLLPTSSSAWQWVVEPPKIEPRPWSLERDQLPLDHPTMRIRVDAPFCSGEARPVIDHVRINRSPRRVVIRAYVKWPEPLSVSGEVGPDEPVPACAGLVAGLHRRVAIGSASDRESVMDGFFQPPRLVATRVPAQR